MRRALLVALIGALAAVVTGCGGNDKSVSTQASSAKSPNSTTGTLTLPAPTSTTSRHDQGAPFRIARKGRKSETKGARRAVEAVLASGNPAKACSRYVTDDYIKAAYGDREGCIQAQGPGSSASSLQSLHLHL